LQSKRFIKNFFVNISFCKKIKKFYHKITLGIKTKTKMNVTNSLYIAYFWKNATYEMIEDLLDFDVDSIASYILEMGKYFYEQEQAKRCDSVFSNQLLLEKALANYKI